MIPRLHTSHVRHLLELELSNVSSRPFLRPPNPVLLPHCESLRVPIQYDLLSYLTSCNLPRLQKLALGAMTLRGATHAIHRFSSPTGKSFASWNCGKDQLQAYAQPGPHEAGHIANVSPNPTQLICTLDIPNHWDTLHPTWEYLHTLLPSHPNVELIGIRFDGDLWDEKYDGIGRSTIFDDDHAHAIWRVRSLLMGRAFPKLRVLRDVGGGVGKAQQAPLGQALRRFWYDIADLCGTQSNPVEFQDIEGKFLKKHTIRA